MLCELSSADMAMATIAAQLTACKGKGSVHRMLNKHGLNEHLNGFLKKY